LESILMSATIGLLVLVRHGQSAWNHEDRFTGWVDIALTPEGEAEARRAGELLRGYRFDYAFTSALVRAEDTLRIILDVIEQPHVPVEQDAALNERHYGALQGLSKAETAAKYGTEQVHIWRRSYRTRPPGGESLEDTAARVIPYYIQRIEPLVLSGKHVLVVAHGTSLRALVMYLDQLSEAAIEDVYLPTGVPRCYELDAAGKVVSIKTLGDESA
jgi:2,3-bisphosphoglycerate-dependent phosphoglycerate mutase